MTPTEATAHLPRYTPPPIRYGRDPVWVRRQLARLFRARPEWAINGPRYTYSDAVADLVTREVAGDEGYFCRWYDHAGAATYTFNGEHIVCLASEPYGLSAIGTKAVVLFADLLGADWSIEAASTHYPTRTLRILFWPKALGYRSPHAFLGP